MKRIMTIKQRAWLLLPFMILCITLDGSAGPPAPPAPPLPPLLVPAPPPLVVIPGTYVYFPPDVRDDLLFYHGYWYRPYQGKWYRAAHYNGPWGFVALRRVPRVLIDLPHGYRSIPPGHERIPYGRLKKNWKAWERDRHWERSEKKERREERRERDLGSDEKDLGHGLRKGHAR